MKFSLHATWNANSFNLLVLFLCIGSVGFGNQEPGFFSKTKETLSPAGSLRLAYFDYDAQFSGKRNLLTPAAWLSIKPAEWGGLRSFAEARAVLSDLRTASSVLFDLREAYVETTFGPLDIRLGRQVIVWGRADKFNPTDTLTTKALTLLTTDDEDQRLGITSLALTYNWNDYRLIAVWQPEWRQPNYPIPPLSGIALTETDPVDAWQQAALKLDRSGGKVDWSVSYFYGFNRAPDLKPQGLSGSTLNIALSHQRIHVAGADAATALGPLGLRAEVAYTHTVDGAGTDPTSQNPSLYGVLGTEYSPVENLTFFGQFVYRHVFNYVDPNSIADLTNANLARQVALLSNQLFENQYGASLRVAHKAFHDTLESELTVVGYLQGGGWLVRPKITYALNDSWRLIGGAQFYGGGADTFFGRLQSLSSGFAEARFYF
jgi:hypothetical protein